MTSSSLEESPVWVTTRGVPAPSGCAISTSLELPSERVRGLLNALSFLSKEFGAMNANPYETAARGRSMPELGASSRNDLIARKQLAPSQEPLQSARLWVTALNSGQGRAGGEAATKVRAARSLYFWGSLLYLLGSLTWLARSVGASPASSEVLDIASASSFSLGSLFFLLDAFR
jgi:hypothetical protein